MTETLIKRLAQDPFAKGKYMYKYTLREIEVDGVFRRDVQDPHRDTMISIRSTDSDTFSPMWYNHDGFEIDQEHYLKTGCISSMTKEVRSKFYCHKDHT